MRAMELLCLLELLEQLMLQMKQKFMPRLVIGAVPHLQVAVPPLHHVVVHSVVIHHILVAIPRQTKKTVAQLISLKTNVCD